MDDSSDSDEETMLLMLLAEDGEPTKKRSSWVRESLAKRSTEGEFSTHFVTERNNSKEFYSAYRMTPERFDELLSRLRSRLERQDTTYREAIPAGERLAMTLRYLATGMSQKDVARYFRVGCSTISKIIREVCCAIWDELAPTELARPDEERWREIAKEFEERWNFPNCLGAIDGKHVRVQCPQLSGSTFFNYKGSFSTVLLAVADADYCFTYVDVGSHGSQHDNTILSSSTFGQLLQEGDLNLPAASGGLPFVFIGDEAFQLRENIMRPYPGRSEGTPSERLKRKIYNYRLCRSRRVVESTFGLLVTKWRIFRQPIIASMETVDAIVKSACVLHNFLRRRDGDSHDRRYIGGSDEESAQGMRDTRREHTGGMNNIENIDSADATRAAFDVRDRFAEFFMSPEGSVPWQDAVVNRGRLQQ